jgi:hypothetical protein
LSAFSLGAAFHADFAGGIVNDAFQVVQIGAGIAFLYVLNGAIQDAPADRVFDELRMNLERSPFFIPWAPKKVRRERSVSLETLMFQRTACSCVGFGIDAQVDNCL